jgi:mRNA interferase MazF
LAARGEIWFANLSPTRGREQRGARPVLIVSADPLNQGPAELVIVVPLTTTDRRVPVHVRIDPPNGGVREPSFAMCEAVRSISKERLERRFGMVDADSMRLVDDRLRIVLDL